MKRILVCGELKDNRITSVSKELITTGKKLRSILNQSLDLLLIGGNGESTAEKAGHLGVNRVLTVINPEYPELHPERIAGIMTVVCQQFEPLIILLGQTDLGRDVAPRLAARLGGSVCLDCVDLAYDKENKTLLQTKPVYGGNALAQWASTGTSPHVVTMRPRSHQQAEPDPSLRAEIIPLTVEIDETEIHSRLVKTIHQQDKGIKLDEAKVIIAGGGGIGGNEGFGLIQELADVLGAAVGITRVPSDENWMPKSLEIGQTGHVVSPNLYIAVGISGAPQHLAGCANSKILVAINKDPQAPIFDTADMGIVGDYREVLPALIEKLKALKE